MWASNEESYEAIARDVNPRRLSLLTSRKTGITFWAGQRVLGIVNYTNEINCETIEMCLSNKLRVDCEGCEEEKFVIVVFKCINCGEVPFRNIGMSYEYAEVMIIKVKMLSCNYYTLQLR